jgi:hypothetical protein
MRKQSSLVVIMLTALAGPAVGALRVPAYTAYLEPDVRGARVSERSGVTRWTDPAVKVLWFGQIQTPGTLHCAVALRLEQGATSKLRLTVAGRAREATVTGGGEELVTAAFGSFEIAEAGYQSFTLESYERAGRAGR